MRFYILHRHTGSQFCAHRDIVNFARLCISNQRFVSVIRLDDRGDEFESRLRSRFAPTKRTEQVIGDDDLIEICRDFYSRRVYFCRRR